MKRLRNRLIMAFVGVALLAMIPLALVPYYTLQIKQRNSMHSIIEQIDSDVDEDLKKVIDFLQKTYVDPTATYLQNQFETDTQLVRSFTNPEYKEIFELKKSLILNKIFKNPFPFTWNLEIYPKDEFAKFDEKMKDNTLFYEENNTIYFWYLRSLTKGQTRSEMQVIGGLFAKVEWIKKPESGIDNDGQLLYKTWRPYYYPPIVLNANPSLFENYLPRKEYEKLFDFDKDGIFEEVEVFPVNVPSIYKGITTHALFKPIINQNHELTAVMVLATPIHNIWDVLGTSTLTSFFAIILVIIFAAVVMARSLSRPIYRLASAAHRMAQGDLSTRVDVSGTEEQQVLSFAFNQLASQIQCQVIQLQDKTEELEENNRELEQTHRFLQNILSNINTGVLSVDLEGHIRHLNRFGTVLFEVTEFESQVIDDVIKCPALINLVRFSLNQGASVFQEEIQYEKDNRDILQLQVSTVPLLEDGELNGLVVTFHDLSAIRNLEEQVRRQDRLAALGRMAAGVAHEIRNPLGIIRGSAELLYKRVPPKSTEQELSQFIVEEVNRLSRVVTEFLTFARPPEPSISEVDVQTLIKTVLTYTDKQDEWAPYQIICDIQDDLLTIAADEKQCVQIFLNLLINARDAMPDGGTIGIKSYLHSPKMIAVEVVDNGIGIHPENVDRIFDPFYTSKESGTGLGLSIVHQIITSHGGKIEVDSRPGEGTIFRLLFQTYQAYSGAMNGDSAK